MDYPRTKARYRSVGEGKKHVEGRNRKRSEMERYRARRGGVLTRIERVIRRDPRLHSDTGRGGGGEHALYFLIYPPLPISRDVFVN